MMLNILRNKKLSFYCDKPKDFCRYRGQNTSREKVFQLFQYTRLVFYIKRSHDRVNRDPNNFHGKKKKIQGRRIAD